VIRRAGKRNERKWRKENPYPIARKKRETKKGNRKRIPFTLVKRISAHPLTFYTAPFLVPYRLPNVPHLHRALSVLFF